MLLPGFKTTTTFKSIILDAAVQLVFKKLEEKYPLKSLNSFAVISSGGTPSRTDSSFYNGSIPWAKISDLTMSGKWIGDTEEHITQRAIDYSSAKLFPVNTVLFSMYGSIGKTCITTSQLTTNQAILGLIPKKNIHPQYIYYSLINARSQLFLQSKGTSQKNINGSMVKEFHVPELPIDEAQLIVEFLSSIEEEYEINLNSFPEYIKEIHRIVARIEALAARVNQALGLRRQAIKELDALRDSEVKNLISQNIKRWKFGVIPEFMDVNPSRKGQVNLKPDDIVSFVPMSAVDDISGIIARPQPKPYQEVSKGYTWFIDGDVIFARITPCMENGKSAIARGLYSGVGFGSTEFHVLRPRENILAEWIHVLTRNKEFKSDAADHFKGTAGQQRVPQSFLENKLIPVPPLDEQHRIVAYLDSLQARVDALRRLQTESQRELEALLPSILDRAFKGEL